MSRTAILLVLAFIAVGVVAAGTMAAGAGAAAPAKPETMTVKGEAVDLWCFMSAGARGAAHKECAIACAKLGNPIGIVDDQGNIYLAMGSKDKQPAKDILEDKMAETVEATGKVYRQGGIQAIFIESIKVVK